MQTLTEKYRPKVIEDFVGLEKPRKIFAKFLAAPFPSAWLFEGEPGVGKTAFALALAKQLGADLHHIPSQKCTVDRVNDVIRDCYFLPWAGQWHMVLIDEADRMSQAAQLAFLSLLDATAFPPQTIFVFTCNDSAGLEPRFTSRCHEVKFSSYGINGCGSELLKKVWEAEYVPAAACLIPLTPDFSRIMKDSKNNIREALNALEIELLSA